MHQHEKLNYVEFPACDIAATKAFFVAVFGWHFVDYGADYAAFGNEGLEGGFYRAELAGSVEEGGALLVFYSSDLSATQAKVEAAGGTIKREVYEFPGGRRFHFCEPSGNEFAVWSER